MTMTTKQQETLNINKYEVEYICKMFSKKELAAALVATTCWDETIQQQYREFRTKERMVYYLIDWLDTCDEVIEEDGCPEDLVTFIRNECFKVN